MSRTRIQISEVRVFYEPSRLFFRQRLRKLLGSDKNLPEWRKKLPGIPFGPPRGPTHEERALHRKRVAEMMQPGGADQVPQGYEDAKVDPDGYPIYPDYQPSKTSERDRLFGEIVPRRVLKYPKYDPGWTVEEPWPGKERGRPNPAWSQEQQDQWIELQEAHKLETRAHGFFLLFTTIFVLVVGYFIICEMEKRSKWYDRGVRQLKRSIFPSKEPDDGDDFLERPEPPQRPKYDFSGKPPRPRN